jgi:basic membrane lipoprotein Med (substrate-binding protein (PBP1-ABC) superfamily)
MRHTTSLSVIINWAPYYKKAVKDVLDGTWKVEKAWWGVKDGAIDLVSLSDKVPAAAKAKIDEVKAGLKAAACRRHRLRAVGGAWLKTTTRPGPASCR